MGTLVVGTAHGGACETIADGQTGFLVPPGDVTALADRLDAVLDLDEPGRTRIREAAIRSVRENFSTAVTCAKTLLLYRELLGGRG